MANCPAQYFDVSPATFDAAAKTLRDQHIPINSDYGNYHDPEHNITVAWAYDRPSSTLRIDIPQKPMLIPCNAITARFTKALSL